jgi:hypothetical protein
MPLKDSVRGRIDAAIWERIWIHVRASLRAVEARHVLPVTRGLILIQQSMSETVTAHIRNIKL